MGATYSVESHSDLLEAGRRTHDEIDAELDTLQGRGGASFQEFAQNEPAQVWTIEPDALGRRPASVELYDAEEDSLVGAVKVLTVAPYTVTVTFNQPYSGIAILS